MGRKKTMSTHRFDRNVKSASLWPASASQQDAQGARCAGDNQLGTARLRAGTAADNADFVLASGVSFKNAAPKRIKNELRARKNKNKSFGFGRHRFLPLFLRPWDAPPPKPKPLSRAGAPRYTMNSVSPLCHGFCFWLCLFAWRSVSSASALRCRFPHK